MMINCLNNIYHYSPIWLQNIACSAYGYKLYYERYGGSWNYFYQELLQTQFFSLDTLSNLQNKLFKELLEHAISHVPYYRDIIDVERQYIFEADMHELLNQIPILKKEDLRSNTTSFISEFYSQKKLLKYSTSGTTGSPLSVYISPYARRMNYAFYERAKSWAGVSLFDRSVTFAGRAIVPSGQNKPPYWRSNLKFNNTLFSSYHLGKDSFGDYIDEIRKINPIYIDSYPSAISQLATYCLDNNIDDIRVKSVITSAEMLLDSHREKIEKAFNAVVYDQYGCTEQAVFACQCEKGQYHLNPEFGVVEVVDSNNNPVAAGELGFFVCTSFLNNAMPLIRYKLGDMGIVSDKLCECGRNFPVIEKIYGRNDDVLVTPDGRYVGRLDPIFKGVDNGIIEAQIIQEKIDLIHILLVRAENYDETHGQFIVNELKKRMGDDIVYKISYVDCIARTEGGKFRAVINKLVGN